MFFYELDGVIGSMGKNGTVSLPTNVPYKSTIHVGDPFQDLASLAAPLAIPARSRWLMRSRSRVRPRPPSRLPLSFGAETSRAKKNGYGDLKQAGYRHPELEVFEIHVLVMAFLGS